MIALSSIQILIIYAIHILYLYIISLPTITHLLINYSIIANISLSHYFIHFVYESFHSVTISYALIIIISIASIPIYSLIAFIISTTIVLL
jgi:hypothetical protein